ncbi:MAG: hypothetical protein WBF42_06845, partial [Terracidiphilus sp.]
GSSSAACADLILDSVKRDADHRADLITLLPTMYRDASGDQANRILGVVQEMLNDNAQEPAVRLRASHALADIGSPNSVEVIQGAMLREGDLQMRSDFQSDLNALKKKH